MIDQLDPEVAGFLAALNEGFPPVATMTGAEARAATRARQVPPANLDDVRSAEDVTIPVAGGTIGARVYRPHGADDVRRPLVVFLHGGGFVFCDLESHDGFCRQLARGVDAVVVSVDYRLAPEHPAPTAAEDAYAALLWASERHDELGTDPARVVVAGDSAGGNLAAVVALMTRDRGGPVLAGQALLGPVIDPACDTPSYDLYAEGWFNTRATMEWYWDQYLGPERRLPEPPELVAPARAADHAGLAPAIIAITAADPLRDEGQAYAARLAAAGVPVVARTYPGLFHGTLTFLTLRAGDSARELLYADLRTLFDRTTRETPR
ncbi:alpha/beta hydrolase [Nocardioides sp. WV_118_6]|uniref:alpha/beta hydrolase n=1 Tax=Nocardioides simplex TaxID=2045 RepID=UPI00214FAD48|nr:alpha/beta hydrolase [Pimelobacter simplex]UUW90095.1 alpha/beta hydrolase [Pimelobacter simplex]UUW93924.1 alpha/beta hydrolase [Pimelobacter simplex]